MKCCLLYMLYYRSKYVHIVKCFVIDQAKRKHASDDTNLILLTKHNNQKYIDRSHHSHVSPLRFGLAKLDILG